MYLDFQDKIDNYMYQNSKRNNRLHELLAHYEQFWLNDFEIWVLQFLMILMNFFILLLWESFYLIISAGGTFLVYAKCPWSQLDSMKITYRFENHPYIFFNICKYAVLKDLKS